VFVAELPFSKIDREAHRLALLDDAKETLAILPQNILALQDIFRSAFPPHLMATIACWGMMSPVGPRGTSGKGLLKGIEQHHIELLQAFSLTIDRREWGNEPASPFQIQGAIDLIRAMGTAFHTQRALQLKELTDPERRYAFGLQEQMRDHTQMVRNWGYYDHMLEIVRSSHSPIDDVMANHHGFSASDLITTAEAIASLHQERLGSWFILLKDILKGRTKKKIVYDYFARYEGVEGDPSAFLASLNKRTSLRDLRLMLQTHATNWLMTKMLVDPLLIAHRTNLPETKVVSIFNALSLVPGSQKSADPQHLFLANTCWLRPGIRDHDEYLFFVPQSLPAFLPSILRVLFEEANAVDQLDRRKSEFLETAMCEVIGKALPGASLQSNVKWQWHGKEFETDLLAILDGYLVIAEAKSGTVSQSATRGAPNALKRHVTRLIVEPAQQSARLSNILKLAGKGDPEAMAVTKNLGIDPHKIDAVVRISITLDDLCVLSSAEFELKSAGWFPDGLKMPPTLNLAELIACAEILSDPVHFLNYFAARERLQGVAPIFGYEMDYLGLYLECGLDLPELMSGDRSGVIVGMSSTIDRYYLSRDTGFPVEKPTPAFAIER
jgi:hypothetical protein